MDGSFFRRRAFLAVVEVRLPRWRFWIPIPLSLLEDMVLVAALGTSLIGRFLGRHPFPVTVKAKGGFALYRAGMAFLREIRRAGPRVWVLIHAAEDQFRLAVRTF